MWAWIKKNTLLAIIIAVLGVIAVSAVADGWSARRAAARYFDLAKGWAAAYQRDTAASKKEYEGKIKALTLDRNAYRDKWNTAKNKMNKPWSPPSNPKDLQERFNRMGYRGRLK